jgi:hypothetical protein
MKSFAPVHSADRSVDCAGSELVVLVFEQDVACMIETRLLSSSLAATHRGFALCLADPIGLASDFWRSPQILLFGSFRRQLTYERPRDFGSLTVVVMNEKTDTRLFIKLDANRLGIRRNLVGLADGRVRFEKREAIFEIDLKCVFPREIFRAP